MPWRTWQALVGHLRVRVRGRSPERLVNLCAREGVVLWDLERDGPDLLASVAVRDLRRLRALRRQAGVRLRVVERRGLPLKLRRLRPLRGGVTLLVLAVLGLYLLSQFVWFLEVEGTEQLDPEEVLRAVRELGLRPGTWRGAVDPDRLARDLVLRFPTLSWAAVRFFGAKATVRVAERIPPAPAAPVPEEVVARRAGVVVHVLVVEGEAAVVPGQTVAPGDVLIRGVPRGQDGPRAAQGRVLARTWYGGYAEVERVERVRARTGRRAWQLLLRAGGGRWRLWGAPHPFAEFDRSERVVARLPWSSGPSPVEIVRVRYDEVVVHETPLSREEAARRAEALLRRRLLGEIGPGARIVDVHSRVVQETPDAVGVRLSVECLEDIARPSGGPAGPLPGP